jgi:hypothetical protein
MIKYITKQFDPDLLKTRLYYWLHGAAVKDMTDGKKIFGENKSPAMEESGKFVKKRWYPLPSNTQFVEARIKDAKLCATTR